jgi:hypothetical protein
MCVGQLGVILDDYQFKVSSLCKWLKKPRNFARTYFTIKGVKCTPYMIGDSNYPIWTYL